MSQEQVTTPAGHAEPMENELRRASALGADKWRAPEDLSNATVAVKPDLERLPTSSDTSGQVTIELIDRFARSYDAR